MAAVVHMITFYLFMKTGNKTDYNITFLFVWRSAHCSFAYSWKNDCSNPHTSWYRYHLLHGSTHTGMQSITQETTSTCRACVCARVCVRACACVCVRARVCARACACACVWGGGGSTCFERHTAHH
jgi:hypothetical protein